MYEHRKAEPQSMGFNQKIGPWYELPIDKSLNQLSQELNREYGSGPVKSFSRNMIKRALGDLSKDGQNSIYQHVFRHQLDSSRSTSDGVDTHPSIIEWEISDVIKAIARARAYFGKKQGVSEEELAEQAMKFLRESLVWGSKEDLEKDYRSAQILMNSYMQDQVIREHDAEVLTRLEWIKRLTLHQPAGVAVRTIREALPILDNLIILLAQEYDPNVPTTHTASESLQEVYERLLLVRQDIRDQQSIPPQFQFRLSDAAQEQLLKNLEEEFSESWRRFIKDANKQKKSEALYNRFLLAYLAEHNAEEMRQLHEFLATYQDLLQYIERQTTPKELQKSIREELSTYVRDLFRDVENGDWLPYTYTLHQKNTARTAFIAERTKYAHEQLRAAIHIPLRLLQFHTYLKIFNIKDAPELAIPVFSLQGSLFSWLSEAEKTVQDLRRSYPELSLLWKAQEPEVRYFYETYASWVFPVFHRDVFQYEQLRDASQVIAHDGTDAPIMSIINGTSILLKANGQLVAAFIVDQATQEIMEQYDALLSMRE